MIEYMALTPYGPFSDWSLFAPAWLSPREAGDDGRKTIA
jgi:hypothetical protein